MISLARKLRLADFFSLGFGTMIGVGWLVVMDDWLGRGGPLGAILGFVIGGAVLLPIGYVYGKLVRAMPDAAGEIAYTAAVFPRSISFATGWMMLLAYYIVCPWEAVAIGRIAGYLFPALNSLELYRIAGKPVYLPHLAIGLALTIFLTVLNYRGIRLSASFQNWTTFGVITLVLSFVFAGARHGSIDNFRPMFSSSAIVSVLLVLQIVPYFMTGFESIGKASEEASSEFQPRRFMLAILLAIVVGAAFYVTVIAAVAYVAPWQTIVHERFATAVAFERARHPQRAGLFARKAEAIVVFRIADQDDGAIAELARGLDRAAHHRTAEPAAAAILRHRDRAEQQRLLAQGLFNAAGNVPQPRGADDALALGRDERQAFGRQAVFAQPFRGLAIAVLAEGLVEQCLARVDVGKPFVADLDHGSFLPRPRRAHARALRRRQFE